MQKDFFNVFVHFYIDDYKFDWKSVINVQNLSTKIENENLILNLRETISYQPLKEIFYKLKIQAENIEVIELERYNL